LAEGAGGHIKDHGALIDLRAGAKAALADHAARRPTVAGRAVAGVAAIAGIGGTWVANIAQAIAGGVDLFWVLARIVALFLIEYAVAA